MAFSITVPRLGWSMEEGTFVRWMKQEGEFVQAGDPIFELEGEKAAQDIEAVDSGILRIPSDAPQPGTIVAVGTVIGYLVADGESIPANTGAQPEVTPSGKVESSPAARQQPTVAAPETGSCETPPAAAPSVRRLAREMKVKLTSLDGSGPAGRITVEDVRTTMRAPVLNPGTATSNIASPRARRVARELGIDWRRIPGTGRQGRVREADVRNASATLSASPGRTAVPISSRRRTIANRMLASQQQTAPVTLTTRIDATNLVGLRNQFKLAGDGELIPSYTDIITKLVSLALKQHPVMATRAEGEQWFVPSLEEGLHIGLAVDTDGGLVVPVVRNVGGLSLFELARETQSLISLSRAGTLSVAQMQDGVFTISNLGSFGIDSFTPIINLPETAVLGLGRIRREPVVVDDSIVVRDQMTLSLTFDHRVVDGAPAARFLQSVSQAIENPSAWLLRGNA